MQAIQTLSNGCRIVKRYRAGRCYASVWADGTTDSQIEKAIATGQAAFLPYNEATGETLGGTPKYFQK